MNDTSIDIGASFYPATAIRPVVGVRLPTVEWSYFSNITGVNLSSSIGYSMVNIANHKR